MSLRSWRQATRSMNWAKIVPGLTKRASVPPANTLRLNATRSKSLAARSDLGLQAFGAFPRNCAIRSSPALANRP